jgi:hypothetical protein
MTESSRSRSEQPTHLDVWKDLWSLYCECFRDSFGQHPVELSPVALEEFAIRLKRDIESQLTRSETKESAAPEAEVGRTPQGEVTTGAPVAAPFSSDKPSQPSAYLFNGHAFTPNLLTSDQRARAVPLYAITPSHGGERSMPAMTDTLLSEMIEAWFAEHPVEPYIKREDEPEFFKRVERVYRAVERRMTPSASELSEADDLLFRCHLAFNLGRAIDQSALRSEIKSYVVLRYKDGPKGWLIKDGQ